MTNLIDGNKNKYEIMNLDDHKFLNMERYILFYSL